jgi:endo-1,4-beta-xylanase
MKHYPALSFCRGLLLTALVFCTFSSLASAQIANTAGGPPDPSGGKANQPRKQQPEAKWVMPPIEGPNLHHQVFASRAAGEKVSYLVYLPPGYENSPGTRYPVVYWLHGIGGNQAGVPRLCERITQAIGAGKAPAMIFVFVNGMVDSFYCDALNAKRPVESVITRDLIPQIDATYRTVARREGRMIEGFSMGGFGAARLGCKYPELFGSISIIDGALLELAVIKQRHQVQFERIFASSDEKFTAESPSFLTEKNADAIRGRTVIRMEVGALAAPNAAYHSLLERLKIDHSYEVHAGVGHNLQPIYDRLGDRNWEFYRRSFAAAK